MSEKHNPLRLGNLRAFLDLVDKMRAAQRAYFRKRDNSSLAAAKTLEGRVDKAILNFRESEKQNSLFS